MLLFALPLLIAAVRSELLRSKDCKVTPFDNVWPSPTEWDNLNSSISGSLLLSRPAASSCYATNSFGSTLPCDEVSDGWGFASFYSGLPEGINAALFLNNSCVPPSSPAFPSPDNTCTYGGYPRYIVNATDAAQIATALTWAASRNLRISIKGTGHDLAGRSSGAFSLSIWTRQLKTIKHVSHFTPDGATAKVPSFDAIRAGSGSVWAEVYAAADSVNKVVVGGAEGSVGLGGHIQAGGHGPLSSRFGLAADNLLQATVVTTEGHILVTNNYQNQDLFWAIRGGGGGVYGVVTEFVLQTYPTSSMQDFSFSLAPIGGTAEAASAALDALVTLSSNLPYLIDNGVSGAVFTSTGAAFNGPATSGTLYSFNNTSAAVSSLMAPILQKIQAQSPELINVTMSLVTGFNTFLDWHKSRVPGRTNSESLVTSRLLSKRAMSVPHKKLKQYFRGILQPQNITTGSLLVQGLFAGPGAANVPSERRGSLTSAWRRAYIHSIVASQVTLSDGSASQKLADVARWQNGNIEPVWREWDSEAGSYMNEASAFVSSWQEDFYGGNYEKLLAIKQKHDPTESLYVLEGVGSHEWDYDLDSGRLCRT